VGTRQQIQIYASDGNHKLIRANKVVSTEYDNREFFYGIAFTFRLYKQIKKPNLILKTRWLNIPASSRIAVQTA
jgi:hypothetical protein